VPTLKDLAHILYFSAGIARRKTYPGGEIFLRAASCTSAYEFELYVVCGGLPDLEAGLYQFGPADFRYANCVRVIFGVSSSMRP
jgi:hypothetical protein